MKKLLIVVVLVLLAILAFYQLKPTTAEIKSAQESLKHESGTRTRTKMDVELDKLTKQYPDRNNNSLKFEMFNNAFVALIDSTAKANSFSDLPLKVLSIGKSKDKKNAVVDFYRDQAYDIRGSISNPLPSDKLGFDYIAIMPIKEAEQLDEKAHYFVSANKITRIPKDLVGTFVKLTYYDQTVGATHIMNSNEVDYNAGTYLVTILKLEKVQPN